MSIINKIASICILVSSSSISYASLVLGDSNSCHKVAGISKPFVLKLKTGTDMPDAIFRCVKKAKLNRAAILGVGDLSNPSLTYFKFQEKKFQDKSFTGIYEITSIMGEIVPSAENIHERINLHVTLADANYQTIGGHLLSGTVAAMSAITIIPVMD